MESERIELLRMLAARLERLHVDSAWARRAYGTRGSVIKAIEEIDKGNIPSTQHLDLLIDKSFYILSNAAKEIPDIEELHRKYASMKQ